MLFIHLFFEPLHYIAQQLGQNTVDSHQKDSRETSTHSLTFTPTGNSVSSQLDGEERRARVKAHTPPEDTKDLHSVLFWGNLGV